MCFDLQCSPASGRRVSPIQSYLFRLSFHWFYFFLFFLQTFAQSLYSTAIFPALLEAIALISDHIIPALADFWNAVSTLSSPIVDSSAFSLSQKGNRDFKGAFSYLTLGGKGLCPDFLVQQPLTHPFVWWRVWTWIQGLSVRNQAPGPRCRNQWTGASWMLAIWTRALQEDWVRL